MLRTSGAFLLVLGYLMVGSSLLNGQATSGAQVNPFQILQQIRSGAPTKDNGNAEITLGMSGIAIPSLSGGLPYEIVHRSISVGGGIRLFLNNTEAIEVQYKFVKHGNALLGASVPQSSIANLNVQELVANEVISLWTGSHVNPFILAGGGGADFAPVGSSSLRQQARPLGDLGVGIDLRGEHLGLRLAVQEYVFTSPNFHNATLATNGEHAVEPSLELLYRF